jgi:hypothetical protein
MSRFKCLVILLLGFTTYADGESCSIEKAVPPKQSQVGSGVATAGSDGTVSVKGGQGIYVAVKNNNILGVAYSLEIRDEGRPATAICSYKGILLPQSTVIVSNSLFAKTPISWNVSLSVGEESDAGVLTFFVYSNPK